MDNDQIREAEAELADLKNTRTTITRRLEHVRRTLDAEGMTVNGSRGQVRPHPLLGTERALRQECERTRRRAAECEAVLNRLRELQRGRERVDRINAMYRATGARAGSV